MVAWVGIAFASIAKNLPADDHAHDLVGAFQDLVHAHVAQDALDGKIAQIAVAAVQLQAAIDHLETRIGGQALG